MSTSSSGHPSSSGAATALHGWKRVRRHGWASRALQRYWRVAVEPRLFLLRQLGAVLGPLQLGLAVLNVVIGLLPVAFIVATSVGIGRAPAAVRDGLDSPAWNGLVYAFLAGTMALLLQQLLTPVSDALGQGIKHRVDGQFKDRLMEIAMRAPDARPLEDQASLSNLHTAAEGLLKGARSPGDAAAGTLALLTRYTKLVGMSVAIGVTFAWWAAAVIFLTTMMFRFGQRECVRMYTRVVPQVTSIRRERDYYRELGLGLTAAKELRLFGLTDWIAERYRATAVRALLPLWRERRRVSITVFLYLSMVSLVSVGGTLALMVRDAAAGGMTLTQLLIALQAVVAAVLLGELYHEADVATQFGMGAARAIDTFDQQVTEHMAGRRTDERLIEAPTRLQSGIHFQNVTFRYSAQGQPVLDELNLTLQANKCTAIVGLNGAGKTTLVKLLASLYEPTDGTILVDESDLRDFDIDSWRRKLAVVFQNFNQYQLTAADNIALGNPEVAVTDTALHAAASRAGIDDVLAGLPNGLKTPLARQVPGGTDLSGGQWQRVAIARALYAVDAGAHVLVLDEPTAALDVRAEADFFRQFAQVTDGLTTLLISHRFSSVRHADNIVVLSDGRVLEEGSHEDLLAVNGRYAELFRKQAMHYAEQGQSPKVARASHTRHETDLPIASVGADQTGIA